MNPNFTAAMRRAAASTRALDVTKATRIIQEALGAKPPVPAPEADVTPPERRRESSPRLIDPDAEIVEPEPAAAAPQEGRRRGRRPMGEVLEALRQARSLGGDTLQGLDLPGMNKPLAPAIPEGAQFPTRSFSNTAGSRRYKLYVPAPTGEPPHGLVVMLHGCKQNPDDFATGTRMNAVAQENNLLVAYPEQNGSSNASSCWNWFNPADQARGAGEPSIIAGITREIASEFGIDESRIFVAGLSAGGAMAAVMGETYPDLYAAIGVHSGLAYGSANDVMSAFAAMRGDAAAARVRDKGTGKSSCKGTGKSTGKSTGTGPRTIVFHGAADRTVHPSNAERIIASAAGERLRETGSAGGRSYARIRITAADGAPVLEYWQIDGAGHAWSGGSASGSYADPGGPDASTEMVRFFLRK